MMRVLLIQPGDSARRGPWTRESWDLAVDLGKSSPCTAAEWAELMNCRLLRSDDFRQDVEDVKQAGRILSAGDSRLLDHEGIDWWSLRSLEILKEAASILALRRIAREISRPVLLWTTRAGWPATALAKLLGLPLRAYGEGFSSRSLQRSRHYVRLSRHFSAAQIKEIFLDKNDPAYRWRGRFTRQERSENQPVVLIPSAYTNVSRVASEYARLLPEQTFLLVATRRSARLFQVPANVKLRELASYAKTSTPSEELNELLQKWTSLLDDLNQHPDLALLLQLGMFDNFRAELAQGLAVRDAWRRVLEREPVCSVLCGDDSNVNTSLPVILAARRRLPTLDFHHGAMDGFYLVKRLPSDLYLAKSELERDYLLGVCGLFSARVVVGAPVPCTRNSAYAAPTVRLPVEKFSTRKTAIVFFSEPYENMGMRAEEVYRELLPELCALAGQTSHDLVLKLHPFESARERSSLVRSVVSQSEFERIRIVSSPLSDELLSETWVGFTVESTTVLDCVARGIPCFLCAWLSLSPFGYVQQYAKFGVGQLLNRREEIAEVPGRIAQRESTVSTAGREDAGFSSKVIDPQMLAKWLGLELSDLARPA
jgi:hypothetical protein